MNTTTVQFAVKSVRLSQFVAQFGEALQSRDDYAAAKGQPWAYDPKGLTLWVVVNGSRALRYVGAMCLASAQEKAIRMELGNQLYYE